MKRPVLETRLFKILLPYRQKRLLVAVSGGRDSMVLLELLTKLAKPLQLDLAVAHVHHGESPSSEVRRSRSQALRLVKTRAQILDLGFYVAQNADSELKTSEAALRQVRHEALEGIRKLNKFDFIVYAHHQDDLLETRLIRLLRGTGSGGLLAMNLKRGFRLRPLLGFSGRELADYAQLVGLKWHEDPSNQDTAFFRNWIRQVWLPQLENHRPGASAALARSLDLLTQDLKASSENLLALAHPAGGLDRQKFLDLSKIQKRKILAAYLRQLAHQDFNSAQIDEVIKRLNTVQKNLTFATACLQWSVNAQRIAAVKVQS